VDGATKILGVSVVQGIAVCLLAEKKDLEDRELDGG
jgi:hypothetical protein